MSQTILRAVGIVVLVSGCAATYKPPETRASGPVLQSMSTSREKNYQAAYRVLAAQGYTITNAEQGAGVISTAPKTVRLSPDDADCGTTMSIDYLKDNRTTTSLSMSVVTREGAVEVTASVFGEYKPGSVSQNITLSCVSRGGLEKQFLQALQVEAAK